MTIRPSALVLAFSLIVTAAPRLALAQPRPNMPPEARQAQDTVEDTVRTFGVGVVGGAGLDPEVIVVGAHGTFAPVFHPAVSFRPGIELGAGEVTTVLSINLDVMYALPGSRQTRWSPYIGAGPSFGLSHRGFGTDETEHVDGGGTPTTPNRFDFSDTDFNGGMNFIAGARSRKLFFELRATAWGVSNIRLLGGFNF